MNDKDEFLFTDIALQMFSTFANAKNNSIDENKEVLEALFSSLSDEHGDNPFFMPALIYAFMTHMNIVFSEIAASNDVDESEVRATYIKHYNENLREHLANSMSNRPSMHKEMLALIELDEMIEEGND